MTSYTPEVDERDAGATGAQAAARRRALLAVLAEVGAGTHGLDDVGQAVADRLAPADRTDPGASHRRQIRIALHHTHLPALGTRAGIEYAPATLQVTIADAERVDALRPTDASVEPGA